MRPLVSPNLYTMPFAGRHRPPRTRTSTASGGDRCVGLASRSGVASAMPARKAAARRGGSSPCRQHRYVPAWSSRQRSRESRKPAKAGCPCSALATRTGPGDGRCLLPACARVSLTWSAEQPARPPPVLSQYSVAAGLATTGHIAQGSAARSLCPKQGESPPRCHLAIAFPPPRCLDVR